MSLASVQPPSLPQSSIRFRLHPSRNLPRCRNSSRPFSRASTIALPPIHSSNHPRTRSSYLPSAGIRFTSKCPFTTSDGRSKSAYRVMDSKSANYATRTLYPVSHGLPSMIVHPGFREDIFVVIDFKGYGARSTPYHYTFTEVGLAMVDGYLLARSPRGDDFHGRKKCNHYINANHPKCITFPHPPCRFGFGYSKALSPNEIANELQKRIESYATMAKERNRTLILMYWAKSHIMKLLFTLCPDLADIFHPDSEWQKNNWVAIWNLQMMPAFRDHMRSGIADPTTHASSASLDSILDGLSIKTKVQLLPRGGPDIPAFARVRDMFPGITFRLLRNAGNHAAFTLDVWLRWIQLTEKGQINFGQGKQVLQVLDDGVPEYPRRKFISDFLLANLAKWHSEGKTEQNIV